MFRSFQKKALVLAVAVLLVVVMIFAVSREVLLQSRIEQVRLRQQLELQTQKELLEETIEDNLVMVHGLEAFLAADEDQSLQDGELRKEITKIAQSLRDISQEVLAVLVVRGSPEQPWSSSFQVDLFGSQPKWELIPNLSALAKQSLQNRTIATQAVKFNQKTLLVAVEHVFRDNQLWGFVFSFIDFELVIQSYKVLAQSNQKTHIYAPTLKVSTWNTQPQNNQESVTLTTISNITLFQQAPTHEQTAVFPLWAAIPLILFLGLGSASFTYLLSFERAKSNWFALFDPLTGIANRRALEQHFSKLSKGHMLFFNIDNFRSINEKYGFSLGDQVLLEVTAQIQQTLASNDFIARLGSDEFIILPKSQDAGYALKLAERIQQSMTESMLINRQMIRIVTIIGFSAFPKHGTDLSTLIEYADHHQLRDATFGELNKSLWL